MGKRYFRWLLIATGLFLITAGLYTVKRLNSLGAFAKVVDESAIPLMVMAEVPGPEDLEVNREHGILYFISSNPCSKSPAQGGIYWLPLDSGYAEAQEFVIQHPKDFHPHGLSYLRAEQGEYLFTNNHRTDGSHTVEIFIIVEYNRLEHQVTITGNELTSPNDLAAVGPRQFYVTNDGRSHDRATRSLDTFLGRKTGNVLYYDGSRFTKIVDNLYFPNGIALNMKLKRLYVAETLSGNILSYQLVDYDAISSVDKYFAGVGLDNISLDESGAIFAAVHSNLWALSRHMQQPGKPSPSKVIHIDSQTKDAETIYQHTGTAISGISTAIEFKGSLYLGAVCDNKLVKIDY